MSMPIIPPFAIKASYQNSQMATGTYTQGGSQVFSHLTTPPTSGVAAETAADAQAHALGFSPFSARNEVQLVTITGAPTGGTFTLSFGDQTTGNLPFNAAASAVATALNGLSSVPGATGGTNEVQTVTITGTPTGGTFTLTYSGQTTAGIAFNANAAAVQTALQALSNVGAGNVTVTGGPGPATPFTVTFTGTLAHTDVAQMTASAAGLTGGTPAVTVTTGTPGVAQTPNVTVTGGTGGPYTVTFQNALTNENVALLGGDGTGLTGGTNPDVVVTVVTGGRGTFVNQALQNAHQQSDAMRDFYDSAGGNHH